jgi:hypothetical protein
LNFQPQRVGTTSSAQLATVVNSGQGPLTISKIVAAGDFTQTSNCPGNLPAGKICKISVRFAPKDTGVRAGTVTVTDSDPTSPQVIGLTGIGTNVTLSPLLVTFSARVVGRSGPAKTAILTNRGTTALTISSIAVSGDYTQTNTCASGLAPGSSCTFTVQFVPTTTGTRFGTITINDSDGGSPHVLKLTGVGTFLTVSQGKLGFGSVKMGASGTPLTFALINKGNVAVTLSQPAIQDLQFHNVFDYSQTNTCAGSLAARTSCTFTVAFSPLDTGNRQATLLIFNSETATSPQQVALSGTGLAAPVVSLTPADLSFADQPVGLVSPAQVVTLLNNGSDTLHLTSILSDGDFSQTNTCGSSVEEGASCSISVVFTPTSQGAAIGAVTLVDDAANSPQKVSLTGNGVASAVSLSPSSLSFPDQLVGTSSTSQTVTLTNSGTGVLEITSIVASGDFAQSNACGSSLAPGASCPIDVSFTPTGLGSRSGAVTITDSASDSPQTVSLSGNGVAPAVSLSSTAMVFPDQIVGTTSEPEMVTLTNTGTAPLNIAGITSSGDFAESNDCNSVLGAGMTCTITVTFTPSQVGAEAGAITITDDAADSPQMVSLSGNGS